ncbi:eukaryotic translation elongation factor 1 delta a (guanine nucleotide exchange protein) isoform X2 [Nelusetta ayraudi]|uniref:eukaryotic translation elongation factor 1 delta a (guanine nucleotide exchange protein) isoform X2 n=1 Tax=Nelusetta ayraudi TaxID=303726 RepID=UPI003F71EEE1
MDQSVANSQQGQAPQQAFQPASAPSKEKAIVGAPKGKFGRPKREVRLSQSEGQSCGAEDERFGTSLEAKSPYGQSPVLQGMHAKNSYHRNGHLSSSPRSPNTRGHFQARRTRGQQQDEGHSVPTVKASGIPHRQSSRGRNRTSSETEQGGQGSRGPYWRRRGFSEAENGTMSGLQCLTSENIWFDKHRYDEAEKRFYEGANGPAVQQQSSSHGGDQELVVRMRSLEVENQTLHKVVETLRATLQKLEVRVAVLEKSPAPTAVPCTKAAPVKQAENGNAAAAADDDDDDIDLFGSDEDDEEASRIKQERLDAYAAKKSKKPALIAKSSILLDVKPWDDETDMAKLEECVRSVQMDGLLWGASKLVPVGYGIKKLQINCVVEDDKVGTDLLEEEIMKFEDYIQSMDVAAFNKI